MLRRKAFAFTPQISQQPHLLSHFVHELMSFDTNLKDDWNYDGGSGIDAWKGLTWEVLVQKDWFGRWLEVEKDCEYFFISLSDLRFDFEKNIVALARYQTIISTPESGALDYDSVGNGATKPTKAAIRVNDLLETITGTEIHVQAKRNC